MKPLTVVKLGGEILQQDSACRDFAAQVHDLHAGGNRLLIVHGGGGLIDHSLKLRGIPSRFVRGLRVTDGQTMEVVEAALAGTANKRLVCALNGGDKALAVGISGQDGGVLRARPLNAAEARGQDYGQVGQVDRVDRRLLDLLLDDGRVPVLAPIGLGADGLGYNVNADFAAAAVAIALGARCLALASDVAGVLDDSGQPMARLGRARALELIEAGVIADGMIPKIEQVLRALEAGVEAACIFDGRRPGALLDALNESMNSGTRVVAD